MLREILESHHQNHADKTNRSWMASVRLMQTATDKFAELNDWRQETAHPFGVPSLGHPRRVRGDYGATNSNVFDHPLRFRRDRTDGKRGTVCFALVGQPYGMYAPGDVRELLRAGYICNIPPDPYASIWLPGSTLFLVWTREPVTVKWLPEQTEGGKEWYEPWSHRSRESEAQELRELLA